MPIIRRWRLPSSGTEVRHKDFHAGQESPRWGNVEQLGKFIVIIADVVINHVSGAVTAVGYGLAVRTFEEPLVLVVALDGETAFVNEFVML